MQETLTRIKPEDLNNHFWQFANHVYAIEEVSKALLELQDLYAENVCFILYLLWLFQQEYELDVTTLLNMKLLAETFEHAFIAPIRSSRRQQKTFALNTGLYAQTKALELALEQQLIAILYMEHKNNSASQQSNKGIDEKTLLTTLKQIYADNGKGEILIKIISLQQCIRIKCG